MAIITEVIQGADEPGAAPRGGSRRLGGWLGTGVLTIFVLCAAFPGWFTTKSPIHVYSASVLTPPSSGHFFGTDSNGMDIFSRIIWSARIDLTIALASTMIAMGLGMAIGAWAGFSYRRRSFSGYASELVVMRIVDAIQAFPVFVLALALAAALGRNVYDLIYVLVFVNTPLFLRLTRSAVISARGELFVDAARLSGNSERRLLWRHVVPNSMTPSLVNASAVAGNAILLSAGLSFVGAGVAPPRAEWGSMVAEGATSLYTGQWWPALAPGVAIGLAVLALAQVGDLLERALDPTSPRSRGMQWRRLLTRLSPRGTA